MTSVLSRRLKAAALALPLVLGGTVALSVPVLHAQESVTAAVDVDALLSRLPPDLTMTINTRSVDAATGWTVLEGVTLTSRSEPSVRVTASRIVLGGVDLDAFEMITNPARYGATPDETFRKLMWGFTIEGLSVMDGTKEVFRAGSIEFGGLEMKQLAFKPPGEDMAAYEAQFGPDGSEDSRMMGTIFDSSRVGEIKLRDLKFFDPDLGGETTFASLDFAGFDRGRLGAIAYAGFASTMSNPALGETITTAVESATFNGFDFSAVLPFMINDQTPPMTADPLLWVGAGEARNTAYNLGAEGSVVISSIRSDDITFAWFIPTSLRFAMDGIYTPGGAAANDLQPLLDRAGQSNLPFAMEMGWSYDPNSGVAALAPLSLTAGGFVSASLSVEVGGLSMATLSQGDLETAWMGAATFNSASLVIANDGNLATLIDYTAEQDGMTGAQAREQAKMGLAMVMMEAGLQGDPRGDAIVAAFGDFLDNPRALTIALNPPAPVMMMMMMMGMNDPRTAIEQLGLTVTHE
ncbi:MAG TPA: hypothetical protein PLA85_02855 [Micropepsaceae bacterium]|nr:hypothetical protein [Micropepsaceae bacterium]